MTGNNKQEGFAIVFILIVIALIITILGETLDSIKVESKASSISKSLIASEIALDSGLGFFEFLYKLNKKVKNSKSYKDLESILPGNLYDDIQGIPIGKLNDFSSLQVSKAFDLIKGEAIDMIQSLDGYFVINSISYESQKINLNALRNERDTNLQDEVLLRVFASRLSDSLLSIYSFTPQDLKDNIFSYITERSFQNQSAYKKIGATYTLKQGALQTLDELRRAPGINYDDIYNVFKNYFTVWPMDASSNDTLALNGASSELVASLLTPLNTTLNGELWKNYQDTPYDGSDKPYDWFKNKGFESLFVDQSSEKIVRRLMRKGDSNVLRVEMSGKYRSTEIKVSYIFLIDDKGGVTPLHYIW